MKEIYELNATESFTIQHETDYELYLICLEVLEPRDIQWFVHNLEGMSEKLGILEGFSQVPQ